MSDSATPNVTSRTMPRGSVWTNGSDHISLRRKSRTIAPRRSRVLTRWTSMLATLAMIVALCVAGSSAPAQAADPVAGVPLGLVSTFAVLTPAAVGNAAPEPVTVVRGDIGVGVGGLTGFPPGIYTGTLYEGAASAGPALADLQVAFDDAKARPAGATLPGALDGTTVGPGVHTTAAASGTAAGGTFTIDGEGDPDAVFIFQLGGALALGANTTIELTGGAQAKNVYWAVTGAGSIGAASSFVGTLMTTTAIDSGAGSTINGRLLSLGGAITMGSTQIYSSPPTVTIDGGENASSMTSAPTISGTTSLSAPATVSVTIDGVAVTPNPIVSATGTWSFASAELIDGNHTIVARVTDGADNVGSFTQILNIDTEPPEVTIDGGLEAVTNNLTPRITGTTDIAAGERVTVTFTRDAPAATLTRTTLVQDDLTWNMSPNGLSAGEWTVVATVTDTAGNQNSATQQLIIDVTAPSIAITSSALTNDPTPTITGTTESGATVAVTVDGIAVPDVVVTGDTWTAATVDELGHGTHHVSVAATDAAGNTTSPPVTQRLMVDLILPLITINPGTTDTTNDQTPTIVGTTDVDAGPGVIVSVSIDGGAPLSAVVQADGWNVTPSTMLAAGDHTIVATVSDPAGNIGSASQILTIDVDAPTVVIDGGPSRTTSNATPTIKGSSSDVAVGSPVTVTINGQTLTTTIAGDGTFAVTATTIPNGTHFALVTVTDRAGNIGSNNQALTIDAHPPTVTFANGPTASTNDPTPLIRGTTDAPVGSAVVVTAAGQTLHAWVQPGGSWNVTAATISNGEITIVAEITDPSGNTGSATQILTIDATSPTTITIDGGDTFATNDPTPTISGTTDAADGRVLTVAVVGRTMVTSVDAGRWAVTATHIDDGTYTVTVTASAADGNAGSATQSLTIATVAPVVVVDGGGTIVTDDPTPQISGSDATPGSTVTVTVGDETLTTIVAPDGTWTVTPTTPLPAGEHLITITITDPAGNTGTGTVIIIVEATATTITFDGGTSATTNDNTPTIAGSTNAADGRVLTVTISDQTITTVIAGGLWAVDAAHLDDGEYNITASVSATDGTPAAASQTLTIGAVNRPPVATDQSISTNRNTAKAITVAATDPDADTLTFGVATQPANGDLTGTAPNLTYTPDTDYVGTDSFTFTASDATSSDTGTVAISVNPVVPGAPTIVAADAGNASTAVSWSAPASNGGAAITGYVVTPYIGAIVQTPIAFDSTATSQTITGLINGATYTFKVAAKNVVGTGTQSAASDAVTPESTRPDDGTVFVPIMPCRVVDTRNGGGAMGSGVTRAFQVSGSGSGFAAQGGKANGCGIPAAAVAVAGSVTAVAPTGDGFFRAWPSGGPAATATFLNFSKNQGTTNTGAIALGTGTKDLTTRNYKAKADYVIDVQGYFVDPADVPVGVDGSVFVPVQPCRVADTREAGGLLSNGEVRSFQVAGNGAGFAAQGGKADGCAIPDAATGVSASVSAVDPQGTGFFRAWPSGGPAATATFLNFSKNQGTTNTGAIALGTGTKDLTTRNYKAKADYVIDVQGYFITLADLPADAVGSTFVAVLPCRVADTREGGGPLGNGTVRAFQVTGNGPGFAAQGGKGDGCAIPANAAAVEASVSAVDPQGKGFFRAWPTGAPAATATFLNYNKNQGITNTGAIGLGSGTKDLTTKNFGAITEYVIDVQGYYVASSSSDT